MAKDPHRNFGNMLTAEQFKGKYGKRKSLRNDSKAKNQEMTASFLDQCVKANLPRPLEECELIPSRKFRVDFFFAEQRIVVEVEGGAGFGGRHQRPEGYQKDMFKYNELTRLGFFLFRFTVEQVHNGEAIAFLKSLKWQ